MAKINVGLSEQENLLLLLNAANPGAVTPFTLSNVVFDDPQVRAPDSDPHNSSCAVTGIDGQGYTGVDRVTYNRLVMYQGVPVTPANVAVSANDTEAEIHAKVAAAWGLRADSLVYTLFTQPEVGAPGTVTIGPSTTSLLYAGPSFAVQLVIAEPLAENVAQKQLSGFESADS